MEPRESVTSPPGYPTGEKPGTQSHPAPVHRLGLPNHSRTGPAPPADWTQGKKSSRYETETIIITPANAREIRGRSSHRREAEEKPAHQTPHRVRSARGGRATP